MLYLGCFTEDTIHGDIVSISLKDPIKSVYKLPFLTPTAKMLSIWQNSAQDKEAEKEYENNFRRLIKLRWGKVKPWLDQLNKNDFCTLCSTEPTGEISHRNWVAAMIHKHRPDCFGGLNIKSLQVGDRVRVDVWGHIPESLRVSVIQEINNDYAKVAMYKDLIHIGDLKRA